MAQSKPKLESPLTAIQSALKSAVQWMIDEQRPDGHWVGGLQANSTIDAEWCLALWFLGLENHPLRRRLEQTLLKLQRHDGSWHTYYGADHGDINSTVEAYAALRSMGYKDTNPILTKARLWIESKGGLRHVRVFTRFWLALIGEWPWDKTPNLPPEIIWLPMWAPFNIYNFSSWGRGAMLPLTIVSARRPSRPLPPERRLNELFPGGRENFDYELQVRPGGSAWESIFRKLDKVLKVLQQLGNKLRLGFLWRDAAIRHVLEWIIRHQEDDGVFAYHQPGWIYGLMALHVEGYNLTHPVMAKGLEGLDHPGSIWRIDQGDITWIQTSASPVWDTALTLFAFHNAKVTERESEVVGKAVKWILDHQVLVKGDWSLTLPHVKPGGWCFNYCIDSYYPDIDDTALALLALAPFRKDPKWQARGIENAIKLAVDWIIAMQSKNGGWGAFDKDNNSYIVANIPFCDFGETLDPPSVDVTGHVVEAFAKLGIPATHPSIVRALKYLRREQEPEGPWFGRWGVNYIYGTGAVLPALMEIGEDKSQSYIQLACDWIVKHQQEDGGWGESCASYIDWCYAGRGTTTASQTAWALMSLIAVDRPQDRDSIERGCLYLAQHQEEGSWQEPEFTGTGFPGYVVGEAVRGRNFKIPSMHGTELSRGFMLRYDLYRQYFPIIAMGRALKVLQTSMAAT